MKLKTDQKYWMELEVQPDKTVKVKKARKYVKINQFVTHWAEISSRDLAREINGKLITR
jgi:hypothetical protein